MSDRRRPKAWEKSLRRKLKPEEQAELDAWFALHPDQRIDWEEDRVLSKWVRQLPPIRVSSNFTARVVNSLSQELVDQSSRKVPWRLDLGFPKLLQMHGAVICLVAVTCFTLFYIQKQRMERREVAEHVVTLSKGLAAMEKVSENYMTARKDTPMPLPTLDLFADFDAINQLVELPAEKDAGLLIALE